MPAAAQLHQVPAPEQVRAATRAVLERPEFAEPSQWYQTLWEILRAIKEWLDRLSSWSEAHPTLARIFFALAVLIMLACLGHMLYLALADVLPFRRNEDNIPERPVRWEILQGTATDWQEALQIARAMLEQGDTRRAIWIAHRVLLALLDQQGALKFAGWKTNSHYLRECAAAHPLHALFAELTDYYEQIVYASRSISAELVATLVARVDRLCSEAGTRP